MLGVASELGTEVFSTVPKDFQGLKAKLRREVKVTFHSPRPR